MNTVSLNTWIADIIAAKGIVGVNPDIAIDALRKTAIDFCTQTTIWEYEDHFTSQMNVADYQLNVPNASRIASMHWVYANGLKLTPVVNATPFYTWPMGRDPNTFYAPGYNTFVMEEKEFLWISPVPQDDETIIRFKAALKPTQDACILPEFLYEDFNDALTAGTAYRLFQIPKQEWTNSSLAMLNQKEYTREKARARQQKAQGNTQATLTMSGSYF